MNSNILERWGILKDYSDKQKLLNDLLKEQTETALAVSDEVKGYRKELKEPCKLLTFKGAD